MSEYREMDRFIQEANRQLTTCNACRYCEGFCSVFPAVHRLAKFSSEDVIQLSNLCHNCRACHYACQFTEPHEYNINLPRALADVRVESYIEFSRPQFIARAFQRQGVLVALIIIITFFVLMMITSGTSDSSQPGFYAFMPHELMVMVFAPAFLFPLVVIALAVRAYWKKIGGQKISKLHIRTAFLDAAKMKNLAGGQGQGCNFEKTDRYSNARRYLHQFAAIGFLLCFASTSTGTLMHYLLDMPAPYVWYSLPKILGVTGGMALVIGCAGLAWLKTQADESLGAQNVWGAEMAFVVLLGLTGLTGLVLYALTGYASVGVALNIHLASVMTLFLLMPYSKMVHGFFRMAALIREAQQSHD
ncbi:tricarballylate utilization 4Fe-4S protein TcuB [Granulosicoccus sp.]|nr:tricarballylate utilization 4Fe-4S protein TcuB [Granulosicoccus sp.]MDB4224788.1 tricarballylate utilization 4Fe-4S protein TcuB [Granulosicoccus sp.]